MMIIVYVALRKQRKDNTLIQRRLKSFLGPTFFWGPNCFWDPKLFWEPKFFGNQNYFLKQNFFRPQFILNLRLSKLPNVKILLKLEFDTEDQVLLYYELIFNERKLVLGPLDVKVKVKVKPKKFRNSIILSELPDDL